MMKASGNVWGSRFTGGTEKPKLGQPPMYVPCFAWMCFYLDARKTAMITFILLPSEKSLTSSTK
jgi:hypothetical protein